MFEDGVEGYRSEFLDDVTNRIHYYHVNCVPADNAESDSPVLPLWAGTEWDFEPVCEACHMPIIVGGLTEQGLQSAGLIPVEG